MSTQPSPALSTQQQTHLLSKMFTDIRSDLAATITTVTGSPVENGYFVQTEAAGKIVARLTRAMSAMEALTKHVNGVSSPTAASVQTKPTNAMIGTFIPDTSPSVTESHSVQDILAAEQQRIQGMQQDLTNTVTSMVVGSIQASKE